MSSFVLRPDRSCLFLSFHETRKSFNKNLSPGAERRQGPNALAGTIRRMAEGAVSISAGVLAGGLKLALESGSHIIY